MPLQNFVAAMGFEKGKERKQKNPYKQQQKKKKKEENFSHNDKKGEQKRRNILSCLVMLSIVEADSKEAEKFCCFKFCVRGNWQRRKKGRKKESVLMNRF
jgi:hypothetical protein